MYVLSDECTEWKNESSPIISSPVLWRYSFYYLIRSARARSDQEPMTEQMDQTNAIHSKEGVKSDEERKKKIKERRKRRGSHSVCSGGKKKEVK